jgi:hypothetical protein
MHRLSHPLLLLCLVAGPVAADDGLPWANKFFTGKEEAPPPVIVHDFGTLPKGAVRTHRFPMKNIYAFPMQVEQPRPSCGCVTVLEYTGKMDSKETGYIEIKIDTSRVVGVKEVQLPVKFIGQNPKNGQPFWSIAQLQVRAVSRPDILMEPGAFAFGVNAAGAKNSQSLTLTYSGRLPGWKVTDVTFNKDMYDVTCTSVPAEVRGTVAYLVKATLKEGAPVGKINDQIVLKTNDPAAPALMVTVTGEVQAALSLVGGDGGGDSVRLGAVELGKKIEKKLIVRNDKPFKIAAISGQGDGVTVMLLPIPAAKSHVVTVQFQPEKIGAVKKTLVIKTDAGETIELRVEAAGIAPAADPAPKTGSP